MGNQIFALGKNIEAELDGSILTLRVNLAKDQGPTKSGRNLSVATTEGNKSIPGHESTKIGVNVYRYRNLRS